MAVFLRKKLVTLEFNKPTSHVSFVGKIHAASGGNLRLMPNWLGAARENCTEEEFLDALRREFANGKSAGPAHKFWIVVRHFRARKRDRL